MLAEVLQYAVTPASRAVHRRGQLAAAVSLWARARRCRTAWAPHEERTRAAILRGMNGAGRTRTAAVLGSGLLRDVPIRELVAMFDRVILVDVVHLTSVRLRVMASGRGKVSFLTRDLSGYDELVGRERIRAATGQDDIGGRLDPLGFLRRIPDLDFVASANLLSTIGAGAVRRMTGPDGHRALLPPDAVTQMIAAHLDGLASLPCRTCLVTDVDYVVRDRAGNLVEAEDLLHGVELPPEEESWEWTMAPFGEEDGETERVHRVVAIQDVAFDLG